MMTSITLPPAPSSARVSSRPCIARSRRAHPPCARPSARRTGRNDDPPAAGSAHGNASRRSAFSRSRFRLRQSRVASRAQSRHQECRPRCMRRFGPNPSSGSHLEQFGQRFSVGSQDCAELATFPRPRVLRVKVPLAGGCAGVDNRPGQKVTPRSLAKNARKLGPGWTERC
jgi:hypothetical protein